MSRRPNPDPEGCAANFRLRTLDQVGYAVDHLEAIRRAIRAPDGLVLIVGPAGSGRRTALSSMLEDLEPSRHAVRIGERALQRALRSGAKTILLERIADASVAQLAIQAAQTGCLVLSTMAVSRACGAIAELRRLRVTTPQIIDGLSLVIGQRLIRRLCPDCSTLDDREPVRRALAGPLNTWLYGRAARARQAAEGGCTRCWQAGYAGLVLAYELLEIDTRARGLIASVIDPVELEHALLAEGSSIWDCGLRRVADGVTSFDALLAGIRQPR